MPLYTTRVHSRWPAARTFAFMADLRNFEQWDPGVRSARLLAGGEPGVGAAYEVTVGGVFRDIVLRYETIAYDAPRRVVVRADNSVLTSRDEITVEVSQTGSEVIYAAGLDLRGPLRVLNPLLGLVFKRIVNRAADGLRVALARDEP